MGSGKGRPGSHPASLQLTRRRFAWALVAMALLVAGPATVSGNASAFVWVDFALCIVLAAALLSIGSRNDAAQPPRAGTPFRPGGARRGRWRETALVLSALITIFAPVVKLAIGTAAPAPRSAEKSTRECSREIRAE